MLNYFWGVKNGGGQGLFKDTLMKLQPQLGIDRPTEDSAEQVLKEMTDKAGPLLNRLLMEFFEENPWSVRAL